MTVTSSREDSAEDLPELPDLTGLRLLVLVARLGSIGAAARAAGTTQQSASERLRVLESREGLHLLHRGARGTTPTADGAVVVEWAGRLLDLADEVGTAMSGLRRERDRGVVVWSSMTVAETLLPRWLVLLRQRQVGEGRVPTAVSLRAGNSAQVVDAVRRGEARLGFVEGVEAPAGVASDVVATDELVLVVAPGGPGGALARRRAALSPAEVAELAMTSREPGSGTREVVERALGEHGLRAAPPVAELTTATAQRQAVVAGSAPAFLSRRVVERELGAGELLEVPTRGLRLARRFRAVWDGPGAPPAGPVRDLVGLARRDGRAPGRPAGRAARS